MGRLTFEGNFCDIAMCDPGESVCPEGGCSAKKVWERLKEYEDTGLTPEEIRILERALKRLGKFGKLFADYKGCPRGAMGRAGGVTLEEEVLLMPKLTDVDGGVWIPVNADALHELVDRYVQLKKETLYDQ